MKTWIVIILLIISVTSCRKKGKTPVPQEPNRAPPPATEHLHKIPEPAEPNILYADEILEIGEQVVKIMDTFQAPQDALDAIPKLRPLSREYRKLRKKFTNCYVGRYYGIYPKLDPVTRGGVNQKQRQMSEQAHSALFRYYAKDFPEHVDEIMAKELPFSLPFPLDPATRQWYESLKRAREETRRKKASADPNTK